VVAEGSGPGAEKKKLGDLNDGSLNVPIEHHPTIRYMVYNGYYKVMSNIPKMGQLPTTVNGNEYLLTKNSGHKLCDTCDKPKLGYSTLRSYPLLELAKYYQILLPSAGFSPDPWFPD